jgi:hypothetical protein
MLLTHSSNNPPNEFVIEKLTKEAANRSISVYFYQLGSIDEFLCDFIENPSRTPKS